VFLDIVAFDAVRPALQSQSHRFGAARRHETPGPTEGRKQMPRYIALVSFTDQGIRDIKNSIKRADVVKKIAAKHKVKIRDIHWTMGRYDIVVLFDAPSDAAMSAFTLENAQRGNVRTETFRAYTQEEFANIIKAI
jgi:uncharacterized protein with GYD domain